MTDLIEGHEPDNPRGVWCCQRHQEAYRLGRLHEQHYQPWPSDGEDVGTSFEVAATEAEQLGILVTGMGARLREVEDRLEGLRTYLANRALGRRPA